MQACVTLCPALSFIRYTLFCPVTVSVCSPCLIFLWSVLLLRMLYECNAGVECAAPFQSVITVKIIWVQPYFLSLCDKSIGVALCFGGHYLFLLWFDSIRSYDLIPSYCALPLQVSLIDTLVDVGIFFFFLSFFLSSSFISFSCLFFFYVSASLSLV
jgi:hypothetical protein